MKSIFDDFIGSKVANLEDLKLDFKKFQPYEILKLLKIKLQGMKTSNLAVFETLNLPHMISRKIRKFPHCENTGCSVYNFPKIMALALMKHT